MTASPARITIVNIISIVVLGLVACSGNQANLPAPALTKVDTDQTNQPNVTGTISATNSNPIPNFSTAQQESNNVQVIITYVKNGNVWISTKKGLAQLTESGKDSNPKLSGDGKLVAFLRGDIELWVIEVVGLKEQKVFGASGVKPLQYMFDPVSGDLFFTTQTIDRIPQNDLIWANLENGSITTLLKPGFGGKVTASPDWKTFAIVQPGYIFTFNVKTAEKKLVFQYNTNNNIGNYYPAVNWLSDNNGFKTVIPGLGGKPARFMYIPAAGGVSAQLAEFHSIPVSISECFMSPDGSRVLYLKAEGDNYIVHVIDASTADLGYLKKANGKIGILGWSSDSNFFIFWLDNPENIWASDGSRVEQLSDAGNAVSFIWLSEKNNIFTTDSELRIRIWGQPSKLVDSGVQPNIDAISLP